MEDEGSIVVRCVAGCWWLNRWQCGSQCCRLQLSCSFRHQAMLTGSDLLAKVKELGDVGKSEIVRACGYVSTKKDGGERLNFTAKSQYKVVNGQASSPTLFLRSYRHPLQ